MRNPGKFAGLVPHAVVNSLTLAGMGRNTGKFAGVSHPMEVGRWLRFEGDGVAGVHHPARGHRRIDPTDRPTELTLAIVM